MLRCFPIRKEYPPITKLPAIQITKPEVFIIESLHPDDEKAKRYEGQVITDMLRLCGRNPKYYYFQSEDELPHIVQLFRQSQYRFLHVSTHATASKILTTNGELTYPRFAQIFKGHLRLRRVFFSACEIGNELFSACLAGTNKGLHSIAAPAEKIRFDHAAAIWTAFYLSVFTQGGGAMKHLDIESRLRTLRLLFPVDFHFSAYDAHSDHWNHTLLSLPSVPKLAPPKNAPPTKKVKK